MRGFDPPFALVAIVPAEIRNVGDPLWLEPDQNLHAKGMAGFVGLPESVVRPLDRIQFPRTGGSPPVAVERNGIACRIRIPAGIEPSEIRDEVFTDKV